MMKKIKLLLLLLTFALTALGCVPVVDQKDEVPPFFSNAEDLTVFIGDSSIDLLGDVTAFDMIDGDLTSHIIIDDSEVDLTTPGVYTLTYRVIDNAGNQSSISVSILVIETEIFDDLVPPMISGHANLIYEIGQPLPNYLEGVLAYDFKDGDLTTSIVVDDSEVDLTKPGTYDLTYRVTDAALNVFSVTVNIEVLDKIAPVIEGTTDFTVEVYNDLMDISNLIVATDNIDGDLTSQIVVDATDVDTFMLGVYDLTYTVEDSSGNIAVVTVKVSVIDSTPPMLWGAASFEYIIGDDLPNYLDGLSAADLFDGDLTSQITYDDSSVNLTVEGLYVLIYSVVDTSGNQTTKSITVVVTAPPAVEDNEEPVLLGTQNYVYYIGDDLIDYRLGITAIDNQDGDITFDILIDDSDVELGIVGVYQLVYAISDASSNTTTITVFVTVIDPNEQVSIDSLNIYYLNDTHGSILEQDEQMGMSKIGNLVLDEKAHAPHNTLFIGGGDILQGTLVSNYFYGSSMMEVLDHMGMDAFVLGNHEFDWGIDVITNYRNPSSDFLQVSFPLLGANIFFKGTTTRPEHIDAYTVIDKGNIKVGIIGVMGYGLESSIATSRVSDYEFADPVYWTSFYAEHLRTVEQVDIVLAIVHGDGISSGYNQSMSALTGNQKVDATFNGHSHSSYAQTLSRPGVDMPYIQSSSNGKNLGKVSFSFDHDGNLTQASATNLVSSSDERLRTSNGSIDAIIGSYVSQIEPLLNEVIMYSGAYISTTALTYYMAEIMRAATDSDIGFHNSGGTRAPILNGQAITVATLYQIFPFDNRIKTTFLSGVQIKAFIIGHGSFYSTKEENMVFEDEVYYKVATNDYVFDQPDNPFITGIDQVDTGILIRDVLEQIIRKQAETYTSFLIRYPIVLSDQVEQEILLYDFKKELLSERI